MISWQVEEVTMDVFIVRHGKAGLPGPAAGDPERELTEQGKEEIEGIARWLASRRIAFDIIATSPLVRARETADIISNILGLEDRQTLWKSLSAGGDPFRAYREVVHQHEGSVILLVGHEPMLSLLISMFITGDQDASISLAKGGIAKIRNVIIEGDQARGELHWLLTPKQVLSMR
jgi:phosphohistidine phosphatase